MVRQKEDPPVFFSSCMFFDSPSGSLGDPLCEGKGAHSRALFAEGDGAPPTVAILGVV